MAAPSLEDKYRETVTELINLTSKLENEKAFDIVKQKVYEIIRARVFKLIRDMEAKRVLSLAKAGIKLHPEDVYEKEELIEYLANYHRIEKETIRKYRYSYKIDIDIEELEDVFHFLIERTRNFVEAQYE